MEGLMQRLPLSIPMIVRHAERMHSRKTVTTRTDDGVKVATFAQVLERARRLATALRSIGVGPDDRVATFCANHQEHLEAYVAVPSMGSILHTLNIRLFDKDLAHIVEHAQDSVVIVDKTLWPAWEKVASRVSCVRCTIVVDDATGSGPDNTLDYEALLAEATPSGFDEDIPEHQAAALCYTSGTTGLPKGVLYSHRSNVLHSMTVCLSGSLGLHESDVVLALVPMFHANAWGLPYACLMAGADLVMAGRHTAPEILTGLLVQHQVTFAAGVPTIWQGMLQSMTRAKGQLGKLERILCGGSAVPLGLQQAYHREVGVRLIQGWGMTESSPIASLSFPLRAHDGLAPPELDGVLNSQGRPPLGVEVRLVDEAGKLLPWDGRSVGEILLRGNWVASGYYLDAAPEKFSDGWLRTGDVASIDPDGYIRICDRIKDLVKSGGEWISSVQIETSLMSHPDIVEAAVVAVAHPRWGERPLACVVPRADAKGRLSKDILLDYLRPLVAKWWLPDDIIFLDQLPRTSVGKFDKKALRERFKDHPLPS